MRKLIFIAGVPRSGTTWLIANCGLHPWTDGPFTFNESVETAELVGCCPCQIPNHERVRATLRMWDASTDGLVSFKRPWCGWFLPIVRDAAECDFSGIWCVRDPADNALSQLRHPGASRPLHRSVCDNWDQIGRMAEFAVSSERWQSWTPLQRGVYYWFLGNAEAVLALHNPADIHILQFGRTTWQEVEQLCGLTPSPRMNDFHQTNFCTDDERAEVAELATELRERLKVLSEEIGTAGFWQW